MENQELKQLEQRIADLEERFKNHAHTGIDSQQVLLRNILPSYIMTPTQLTAYLAQPAVDGDAFTVYNGTDYILYYFINGIWKAAPFP